MSAARLNRCVLLAMLKAPRSGYVKTRLAREIGPDRAAAVYRWLAEGQMANCPPGWRSEVCFAPAEAAPEMREWLGPGHDYFPQCSGDLGARLTAAVSAAFQRGAERLIVVGGDCPGIDEACLLEAAERLERDDVALGPAVDGGYYLVGLRQPTPRLFEGIPWSAADVLEATLRRVSELGLRVSLLPPKEDVDELEALARAAPDWSDRF